MKKLRKMLVWILGLSMLLASLPLYSFAEAVQGSFISLGGNLSEEQKRKVLELLDADLEGAQIIYTSIDDEKALLGDFVPADKIGSRSLSSASVTLQNAGDGISVSIKNIDWVTPAMYTSALATAGVTDAKVVVAAPFMVSGTAALAGILKAYEIAADKQLSDEAKKLAGEELVTTGELADLIGKEDAEKLVALIKQYVLQYGLTDPEKIRPYVEDAAKQLGITLSSDQIETLCKLMAKIATLDIDPETLQQQINDLYGKIEKFIKFGQNANDFFSSVAQWFAGVMDWFARLFTGKN